MSSDHIQETAKALFHDLPHFSETQLTQFLIDFESQVYNRALLDVVMSIRKEKDAGEIISKIIPMRLSEDSGNKPTPQKSNIVSISTKKDCE